MAALLSARGLRNGPLGPVDLELRAGECVVVRGPSGAGKSLLLRALADLDPASGDLRLQGERREELAAPAWRRRVAYLPAEPGWWAPRAGEHFAHGPPAADELAALGLEPALLERSVARLSTGERQRRALLRALAGAPEVLLLDEPTAALDPASVTAVEGLVAARRAAGVGVLWVSHDDEQAARVGDRRLELEAGRWRGAEAS